MVIATDGDPVIRMHKSVGEGARAAVAGLPTVASEGMRAGHAELLESTLGETRAALGELARVADIGAGGAEGLGEQDHENAGKFGGWDAPELQVKGEPHGEARVI
ncbi:hypothetical protein [Mycobacteroides abscessus]|uniref:hypothetical protein n=1 Tax=Mycobacteroides abscessus TaxID=36809 RepID=UPI000927BCEC|nr:hypothetical protein [Mycobacteroides abscessus]SIE27213.1 Uncharacterised protein [Mycobacteroides abscessus subsp. abscessus]SIE51062.1 Uncharacterised protein [Mycobacteroides abscessus subsp. abscessus]SLL09769.1 Uncharacterised protein [Mycobacteroides abscessus subsp. abscessus]